VLRGLFLIISEKISLVRSNIFWKPQKKKKKKISDPRTLDVRPRTKCPLFLPGAYVTSNILSISVEFDADSKKSVQKIFGCVYSEIMMIKKIQKWKKKSFLWTFEHVFRSFIKFSDFWDKVAFFEKNRPKTCNFRYKSQFCKEKINIFKN